MKKIGGPLTLEGRQTKPRAARALNFFLNDGEGHTLKVNKDWQIVLIHSPSLGYKDQHLTVTHGGPDGKFDQPNGQAC